MRLLNREKALAQVLASRGRLHGLRVGKAETYLTNIHGGYVRVINKSAIAKSLGAHT